MWHGYENAVEAYNLQSYIFTHDLESDTETEGAFYWNTYRIADKIFSAESALDGIVCFNEEQALALVNYGAANGIDLHKFPIASVGRKSNRILQGFPVEEITWPIKQLGHDAVSALMNKIK
jgi:DNA-binding LacI/PurR family transcriptional regulator